ncbi:MAG TPA: protein-glutamate O-methyltransferase CheR [Gemmataceae bacterium]|nr:protein-glutamate O-methyltransferase CheR [Gemmataceae bacterium]
MSWTEPEYEAITSFVGARTGLSFTASRRESAELGICRAMGRAGLSDLARYRDLLQTSAQALDDLIGELTVGETYSFREPAQFQFIRREVLPEIRRRRGQGHIVRAWSAGCASGEEAYSLAILVGEEGLGQQAHVLATDVSRGALARARRGAYGEWSLRGEGAATVRPYLQAQGNRYVLDPSIRERVTFEYLNLAADVYPSFATDTWSMDLILCRNVLIYFERGTIRQVAQRLFDSLAEGGWLFTAASDPPLAGEAPFHTVVTDAGVFYRRGARPASSPLSLWSPAAGSEIPAPPARLNALATEPAEASWHAAPGTPGVHNAPGVGTGEAKASGPDYAEILAEAREALRQGAYGRAIELTRDRTAEAGAAALHVRALANLDAPAAERVCGQATARYPLSAELHYLRAVLLLDLGRDEEAAAAARRVLYLDRSLAIAHFTLGSILWHHGDAAGACRAYRNARELCTSRPADEAVPLADGESAGRLAEAAAAQVAILEAAGEGVP